MALQVITIRLNQNTAEEWQEALRNILEATGTLNVTMTYISFARRHVRGFAKMRIYNVNRILLLKPGEICNIRWPGVLYRIRL